MKIISGKYRGRKLWAPVNSQIRPTLQRAKETMFNLLPHFFTQGIGIDVFSGSGQLGIEALSRGFGKFYFNDINSQARTILTKNLHFIAQNNYRISNYDFEDLFNQIPNQTFDLIIIDPPYPLAQKAITFLLRAIDQKQLLAPAGYIIGESPDRSFLQNNYQTFTLKKIKVFSSKTIL